MSERPNLINAREAFGQIEDIPDLNRREAIRLVLEGVEQFFAEQPSNLGSPFDLAFFAAVLIEQSELIQTSFDGTQESRGDWMGEDFSKTYYVQDPGADVTPEDIRERQANNYVAVIRDRRLQAALLTMINSVFARQLTNVKQLIGGEWVPLEQMKPDAPFDYLFMVMAMDYALRTGQPARRLFALPRE